MKSLEEMNEAINYMEAHKKAFEEWQEGAMMDVWRDEQGNLCIKYESGKWWHYRTSESGSVEWW